MYLWVEGWLLGGFGGCWWVLVFGYVLFEAPAFIWLLKDTLAFWGPLILTHIHMHTQTQCSRICVGRRFGFVGTVVCLQFDL